MSGFLHRAQNSLTGHDRTSHSSSTDEPQGSKTANTFDPRVKSGRHHHRSSIPTSIVPQEGKTAGDTNKPYPDDILTSGTVGAHNTEVANQVEQRVVPDHDLGDQNKSQGAGDRGSR